MYLRHVILPKEIAVKVPKRLMSEQEWRSLGVQMSQGWENFMRHAPGKSLSFIAQKTLLFPFHWTYFRSIPSCGLWLCRNVDFFFLFKKVKKLVIG